MGSINRKLIRQKVLKSGAFRKRARNVAEKRFLTAKARLISEFNSHPVTQEIDGGTTSNNTSQTLGGYGNLYTFIGFPGGNPTTGPRTAIETLTSLSKRPVKKSRTTGKYVTLTFSVRYPSLMDMARVTPMPWEGGSWLVNIEEGISNFNHYLYKRWVGGRSGHGVQIEGTTSRTMDYTPTPYYKEMLSKFLLSI